MNQAPAQTPAQWRTSAPVTAEQKKRNQRLGLMLGAIAVALFVGFIVKSAIYGI